MNEQILEIKRLLRNMVRIGTVAAINLEAGTCRVKTGDNTTDWLHWLSARAGRTRSWNAPSPGEQVLILSLGGELNSGFVLPGVFSDASPAPSASADALHYSFPDGAVIEYEPATGALKAEGIQTATIKAAVKILLDTPEVECTTLLKTATLEVTQGGTMKGDVSHSGGSFASNGKVLHTHQHPGDSGGTRSTIMTTARYTGMSRETGVTLVELEHIRQSVRDILTTPLGSRVMRRNYGSLLSALIDQPQNDRLRLQIMSACYMAILQWEPRISLTAINFESAFDGGMVVEITGNRADTAQDFSLTVPVS